MFSSNFCICRFCLNEAFANRSCVDDIKNMLDILIPEMNLAITVEELGICFNCYNQLQNAYNFKRTILSTEEKLYHFAKQNDIKTGKISLAEYVTVNRQVQNNNNNEEFKDHCSSSIIVNFDSSDEKYSKHLKLESTSSDIDIVENPVKRENGNSPDYCSEFADFIEQSTSNVSKYDKRDYICNKCEYKASRYDLLKKHDVKCKLNAESKEFKCKQCSYTSIRKRNVVRHEYQHERDKPYKCDICGKSFVEKFILRNHIYRHMGKAPFIFKCCECGKEFVRKSHLNSHLVLKHPDFRPIMCKVCQRGFVDKDSCRLHARTHHMKTGPKNN